MTACNMASLPRPLAVMAASMAPGLALPGRAAVPWAPGVQSYDPRLSVILDVLGEHVGSPSLRHIQDAQQLRRTAMRILRKLDGRTDPWRKWPPARDQLVRAAAECWIPLADLHAALHELPGPPLTESDVSAKLTALWHDHHSKLEVKFRDGCEALYEREKAAGTELAAIVLVMGQYAAGEDERLRLAASGERRLRKEERTAELNELLLSGADCPWTSPDGSGDAYCRANGRLFRLRRSGDRKLEMHRVGAVGDDAGRQVGRYQTRADATKALEQAACACPVFIAGSRPAPW